MGFRHLFRPSARAKRPRLLLSGSLKSLLEAIAGAAEAFDLEIVGVVDRAALADEVARRNPDIVLATLEDPLDERGVRALTELIGVAEGRILVAIDALGKVALRTVLLVGDVALPQRVLDLVRTALRSFEARGADAPEAATAAAPGEIYEGSEDHLREELRWLGMRLRGALQQLGELTPEQATRRDELVRALAEGLGDEKATVQRLENLRAEIDRRGMRSIAAGRRLRLRATLRGFPEVEADCLLLALGCALEPRIANVVDFLGGREGALTPTACWLAFPGSDADELARSLSAEGLLVRTACLLGDGAGGWRIDPVLERALTHGGDPLGPAAEAATGDELGPLWADPLLVQRVSELLQRGGAVAGGRAPSAGTAAARPLVVSLIGPEGAGRRALAARALRAARLSSATADVRRMLESESFELELRRVARAGHLGSVIVLDHFDALLEEQGGDARAKRDAVEAVLARFATSAVLVSARDWAPEGALRSALHVPQRIPVPKRDDGPHLWRAESLARSWDLPEQVVFELGSRFRLWPGDVRAAASVAQGAALRDSDKLVPDKEELFRACRSRTGLGLAEFATRIEPTHVWGDLVLALRSKRQIEEFVAHVEMGPRVFGEWGFERTLARDRGATALFSGPSGTGKTMAAEVVAQRLGLELWRIDLACVLSKYVSETEKNLSEVFGRAGDNCILFFDEAESLFSQRTDVRDSHDRYANVEVAHLLQLLESYQGVAILATNLRRNLDTAFVRRLRFIVEFGLPDAAQRLLIWRQSLPEDLPRDRDVDLDFLARKLEFSGGSIRNATVRAAFLAAASDASSVSMRDFVRASAAELAKTGRPFDPALFKPFDTCLALAPEEREIQEVCA